VADPIIIKVTLDTSDINRSAKEVGATINNALDLPLKTARESAQKMAQALKSTGLDKAAKDALSLAQATARLQQAQGDLAGAQRTLQTALSNTSQQTVQVIGAKTQLTRVQNQLARQTSETKGMFDQFGLSAGALKAGLIGLATAGVAGLGAGIVKLVTDTAELGAKFADISTKTGLTTETLSALDTVLKQNDSSVESFSSAISIMNRQLGQAQGGNKELAKTFQRLGVDVNATSEDALRQIIARFNALPNEAQKSAFAMKVFGKSGADLIPTLDSLNGDLDGMIKQMTDLGLVVTPQAARQAEIFDDQLKILERQMLGLKLSIGNVLIPQLNDLINVFTDSKSSALDYFGVLQDIASFVLPVGAVAGRVRPKSEDELLPDPLEEAARAALKENSLTGLDNDTSKRRLTDLQQLNLSIEETIKKTNELSNANGALFKSTVALKVEQLDLARANATVQLEFEKAVGIVRLPEVKERALKIGSTSADAELAKLKESAVKMKEISKDIPPLPRQLSEMERFMQSFADATFTAGDAFERLGENFADALLTGRNALQEMGRAVKTFFNDLLGSALQATLQGVFGSIFGGGRGGGGGSILGGLGSIFGGGGLSAPASTSQRGIFGGIFGPGGTAPFNPSFAFGGGGGGGFGVGGIFTQSGALAGGGGILGSLSRSGALPLLGGTIGASLGGSSILGNIAGGIGGSLLGIGLTAAPTSGALAGLAPLFSNPITAIIGGGLLVGSIFLGKAKQRRSDEEASGEMIRAAHDGINQIILAIRSDQIVGIDQARSVFESNVVAPFIQQINTLKTKSVRESRLTNSVRDLRGGFEKNVPPEIAAQQQREAAALAEQERQRRNAANFARQIPQFAGSGFVPGVNLGFDSVKALLTPGEVVLNQGHQADIKALAGADVFSRIGVPGAGQQVGDAQAFQGSGFVNHGSSEPIQLNLTVLLGMSRSGAEEIVVAGMSTDSGRRVLISQLATSKLNREL
jgi:hypothetical protein